MEDHTVRERAYSLLTDIELKRIRPLDSSPEMRPMESGELPPPISLSPSVLENSLKIKELMSDKEQDQYLIGLLKKQCFEQSKEIERLKEMIDNLQQMYEKAVVGKNIRNQGQSIIEKAAIVKRMSK